MTNWLQDIGPGWRPVVTTAIIQIEELGGKIIQVKEKLGGLRIYFIYENINKGWTGSHDDWEKINKIIEQAEEECSHLCEECGRPGKLTNLGGWWKTRCHSCTMS